MDEASWPSPSIGATGPRRVRPAFLGRVPVWLLFGCAVAVSWYGSNDWEQRHRVLTQLERSGGVAEATVLGIGEGKNRPVQYRYRWADRDYTAEIETEPVFLDEHPKGSKFLVTLLPTDPSVHEVGRMGAGDASRKSRDIAFRYGFGVIALLGATLTWRHVARKHAAILRHWPAMTGMITDVKTETDPKGNVTFHLEIQFPVGDGYRSMCASHGYELSVGDPVDLLVNPETPNEVIPRFKLYFARLDSERRDPQVRFLTK